MGTHSRRAFLHSCLTTPIDPCNNCPAPIYNRPKVFHHRRLTTTASSRSSEKLGHHTERISSNLLFSSSGIRSLAKFYDSIPEYHQIHHLTEKEFYSTLNSLRSQCQELKKKPCLELESSNNSTTQSSSSANNKPKKNNKKKTASSSTKKREAGKKKLKNCKKNSVDKGARHDDDDAVQCLSTANSDGFLIVPPIEVSRSSRRRDYQDEVEAFKKTIKDYEDELKNRAISRCMQRAKSSNFLDKPDRTTKSLVDENTQTELEDSPPLKPQAPTAPTSLRKSFSSNDLNSLSPAPNDGKFSLGPESIIFTKPTDTENVKFKDPTRLSNYFGEKNIKSLSPPNTFDLPKIMVHSPRSERTTSNRAATEKSKTKQRKEGEQSPAKMCSFSSSSRSTKKENIETPQSPTMHPVSRPNLAATLRAEVSRRKLQELQNNCVYQDEVPQIDWEVRKTPAWRLMSLNEPHKEILALRLATRKAEQALQRREYEQNMELMRQRVKSAPLLLEGSTHWGPNVGKLTHNCQNEGLQHACDSLKRTKQRKKRSNAAAVAAGQESTTATCRFIHSRNKLNDIQKIYGNSAKSTSQSSHSSSTQRSRRSKSKNSLPHLASRRPISTRRDDSSVDDQFSADRLLV